MSDSIQDVQRLLNQIADSFAGTFDVAALRNAADSFDRYFAYPNANTAINPLNAENPSDSPLPTPADSRAGQTQVNRLAAAQETSRTAIARRDSNREENIPIAHSNASWAEPPATYAPQYPHNQVHAGRAGIIEEYDNTPNNVRRHSYHPSGTYTEIDNNGTRSSKVVGENYEIYCQDNSVYIKGRCNVTVEGDVNLKIMNSAFIDVEGSANVLVKNDLEVAVLGKAFVNAKEEISLKSEKIIIEAKQFDLNIEEAINVKSKTLSVNAEDSALFKSKTVAISADTLGLKGETIDAQGGTFGFHTGTVDFNSASINAGAESAEKLKDTGGDTLIKLGMFATGPGGSSEVEIPEAAEVRNTTRTLPLGQRSNPSPPQFPDLPRMDRFLVHAMNNDEPHEGNFVSNANSTLGAPSTGLSEEDVPVSRNAGSSQNVDVSDVINASGLSPTTVMSKHCSLADLTTNPAVSHCPLRAQAGLTEGQIAANLKHLAVNVIDKIYDRYGKGNVIITSVFRYPQNNPTSQHPLGQAVDIQFRDIPKSEYAKRAVEIIGWLDFDQLLYEYSSNGSTYSPWIHISSKKSGNRNQYATINTANNRFQVGKIINPFGSPTTNLAARTDGVPVRAASDVTSLT